MHQLEVGKQFLPGRTNYQEGAYFEYTASGPILLFAFRNPTQQEIEAAKTGQVELALYETDPVIFILHRVRGLEDWSDSPFSIRLYKETQFNWSQEITEGLGLALQIILIDASTGIIKALRLVGTSTSFTRELRGAILRQLEKPFTRAAYDQKINDVYRNLSSKDLLLRSTAKHKAGRE